MAARAPGQTDTGASGEYEPLAHAGRRRRVLWLADADEALAYSCGSAPDFHRSSPVLEGAALGTVCDVRAAHDRSHGETSNQDSRMSTTTGIHTHSTRHGLAWLAWALAAALAAQIASSPFYSVLIVAIAIVVVGASTRDKARTNVFRIIMIWATAFSLLRVLLIAATTHTEKHVIFTTPSVRLPTFLGGFELGGAIDASTLAFAVTQALGMLAVISVFAAFNAVASHRDLVEALPRSFFELSVAIAVALAFVPSLTKAVGEAREADRARTGGQIVKKNRLMRVLMAVLETALERAVLLSESMDSRGFGRRRATAGELAAGWIGAGALASIGGALVALVARNRRVALALMVTAVFGFGIAISIAGRQAPSKYRSRKATGSDWIMAGASLCAPLGVWIASLLGDSSLTWPPDRLAWPSLSLFSLGAVLMLAVPVLLRPKPRPRRSTEEVGRLEESRRSSQSSDPSRPAVAISFEDVRFAFPDGTLGLDGITAQIGSGETLLVVGSSGSGKSSLLRAINGTVPHSTGGRFFGDVVVGGISTRHVRPRDLAGLVGFVHQEPEAQFVVDEVEGDLAFGLRNLGLQESEIRSRIEEVAERFGIRDFLYRSPGTLSGGEKQRCALAAAVACRPAVLVLDEPTSQLDPEGAAAVFECIEDLATDEGVTVVFSEHRLEQAVRVAPRAVLLERGTIKAHGNTTEVIPEYEGSPEVTRLGRILGLKPPPLTVEDAVELAGQLEHRSLFLQETLDREKAFDSAQAVDAPGVVKKEISCSLQARGIEVAFGPLKAIDRLDFSVESGEVIALLGKNGSGKTTLLRCLAGLTQPDRGTVTRRSRVAYVPQDPSGLFFAPTVRDEVAVTLELMGEERSQKSVKVDHWLEALGISHLANRHPRSTSCGERQRLAVGAVAVGGAEILLLDEPTRGIDASSRKALARFIGIHASRGGAVVLATHDAELAASVATRVVMLDGGKIVADGPPRRVLPGTPYEPQVHRILPPFMTAGEVEKNLLSAR